MRCGSFERIIVQQVYLWETGGGEIDRQHDGEWGGLLSSGDGPPCDQNYGGQC